MESIAPTRVDICVITCKRPDGLQRLLGGIQQLSLPEMPVTLRVVVVDNDGEGSARPVCAAAESWLSFPLVYRQEKRRGIPQARNAAIAESLGKSDFIAFIDDDEVPDPNWLAELLRCQHIHESDAVTGPNAPCFEGDPPPWVVASRLFEGPSHETGARLVSAYTHNVLVATRVLAQMDRLFDERMALCGGSDSEFFERFASQGHSIVWSNSAQTIEWIPESRARLSWLLRRAFRIGTSTTFVALRHPQNPAKPLSIAMHGLWCLAKGFAQAALGLIRSRAAIARGLHLFAYGSGRILGMTGYAYPEYRKVHDA